MKAARWGEDKPIFEEGLVGALVGAAVGLSFASVLLPQGALYALAARVGLVSDPAAVAWFWENRWIAAPASILFLGAGCYGAFLGFMALVRQPSQWHWDGMEYLEDPEQGAAVMQANERRLMSEDQRLGIIGGIEVGGVQLSRTREVAHISLVGLPGAGKTVLANSVVAQALERGDRAIVHDPKGDFTSWLYGDDAVLLGPWDERAKWWDIAADLRTPELATSFAGAMFPDEGGPNSFFTDSAREVVAGLLKLYLRTLPGRWGWDTLAHDLAQDADHLIALAKRGDPSIRKLLPDEVGDNKAAQGILAEVARGTSWITAYAAAFRLDRDELGELDRSEAFSISAWLAGTDHAEVSRVILNNDKNYEVRSQQIFGAIMAAAANYINSSAMPEISADEPGLWVVLDEYPQLGKTVAKYVQGIEELGRSRGVRVVKAVQDESQLFAAVGREKGEAQRSVQQTRIYAKLATGTAAEIAQKLGERDVIRIEFPQAVGAGNKRAVTTRLPVIRADQLTGLRVRKDPKDPPMGVEVVVHTDDVLVKLVQGFHSVTEAHPKVIPSARWERGILDLAAAADRGAHSLEDDVATASATAYTTPTAPAEATAPVYDDDDFPA